MEQGALGNAKAADWFCYPNEITAEWKDDRNASCRRQTMQFALWEWGLNDNDSTFYGDTQSSKQS